MADCWFVVPAIEQALVYSENVMDAEHKPSELCLTTDEKIRCQFFITYKCLRKDTMQAVPLHYNKIRLDESLPKAQRIQFGIKIHS